MNEEVEAKADLHRKYDYEEIVTVWSNVTGESMRSFIAEYGEGSHVFKVNEFGEVFVKSGEIQ